MIKTFVAVVPLAAVMLAPQGSVGACGGGDTGVLPDWIYFSPPPPVPPPPSAFRRRDDGRHSSFCRRLEHLERRLRFHKT